MSLPQTEPESTANEQESHSPPPPDGPPFITFHHLLFRIGELKDLPSGMVYIMGPDRMLTPIETSRIPSGKLADFHAAIAEGRVYVPWGYRYQEHEEIDEGWNLGLSKCVPEPVEPTVKV